MLLKSEILVALTISIKVVTTINTKPALFLTPFIEEKKLEEARNLSFVNPGDFLNVASHSGFLTVDERYNSNLFFWYFPNANKDLSKTPWIIWLQGGPGGSSLIGLFAEMGPFQYINNQLLLRKTSWCQNFSMVFIDNPVGTGFSFTESEEGYSRNMEMYSENLYKAVKQLVIIYPELGQASLYIAGESYAGRYVPGLGKKIMDGRNSDNNINLKGIIMGNPVLDRDNLVDYIRLFYNWGLVDSQGALAAKPLQEKFVKAVKDGNVLDAYNLRDVVLNKLQNIASKDQTYHLLKDDAIANVYDFIPFISRADIRDIIHVGDTEYKKSNIKLFKYMTTDFLASVSPKVEELLEHYRVLIYCGQLDLTASCVLNAEARRRKWRWNERDAFLSAPRTPWWFNGTVAGYVKSGGGFTEVLVTDAGHLVPIDKPEQTQMLITNFILNKDIPRPSSFTIDPDDTPVYEEYEDLNHQQTSGNIIGLTVSVVVNILLLIALVAGVMFLTWKRQNEFVYSPLSEGILTLT